MKRVSILMSMCLFLLSGTFFSLKADEDITYTVVEEMPQYPGGDEAMMKFIEETRKYPEEAFNKGIQGRIVVTFVVEKDGRITDAKVIRSMDEDLDKEALRIVNSMPEWKPGKQKGEAVKVRYTLPIVFRISADNE